MNKKKIFIHLLISVALAFVSYELYNFTPVNFKFVSAYICGVIASTILDSMII